jgi:hypothetical protein
MTTTRPQFRDRLLARALGASLDRQLAAGEPAPGRPARAARAQFRASPPGRRQVIQGWNHLLRRAGQPVSRMQPALPRDRIMAAEPDARYLLALLASPRPVAARGAAMAMTLLTDGTGPVHNRRSPLSLTEAVREAIRQLDPDRAPTPWPRPTR